MKMIKILLTLIVCSLLSIPQLSQAQTLINEDCDSVQCMHVYYNQNDDGNETIWAGPHALENQPLIQNFMNTAFGYSAMQNIVGTSSPLMGIKNTAFGSKALMGLDVGVTGGVFNTAVGAAALLRITDGHYNTAVGASSMSGNTTGFYNTAVGLEALRGMGPVIYQTGNYNAALGTYSLWNNHDGSRNTAVGTFAGHAGWRNGGWTGTEPHNTEPIRGEDNISGSDNIYIGYMSGPAATGLNSSIALGTNAIVTGNNQMVVGSNYSGDSRGLVTESYWGSGVTSTGPQSFSFNATGGKGTNVPGADLILAGGKSTGSANSGKIFFNTASSGAAGTNQNALVNRMVIDSGGRVGIGASNPGAVVTDGNGILLQVTRPSGWNYIKVKAGDEAGLQFETSVSGKKALIYQNLSGGLGFNSNGANRMYIAPTGNIGIGTDTPNYPIQMASGAYVTAGGVWTNASSREYKENISDFSADKAIETLKGLTPVEYNYKVDKEEKHIGFIAEDVPEIVATKDRKGLSSMDIVAVLTSVVKEQQKIFGEQKKTIAEQHKEMSEMKQKLYELDRELKLKGTVAMLDTQMH
jgi:hypothetical protein